MKQYLNALSSNDLKSFQFDMAKPSVVISTFKGPSDAILMAIFRLKLDNSLRMRSNSRQNLIYPANRRFW